MQQNRKIPKRPSMSSVLGQAEASSSSVLEALAHLKTSQAHQLHLEQRTDASNRVEVFKPPPELSLPQLQSSFTKGTVAASATTTTTTENPTLSGIGRWSSEASATQSAVERALAAARSVAASASETSAATVLGLASISSASHPFKSTSVGHRLPWDTSSPPRPHTSLSPASPTRHRSPTGKHHAMQHRDPHTLEASSSLHAILRSPVNESTAMALASPLPNSPPRAATSPYFESHPSLQGRPPLPPSLPSRPFVHPSPPQNFDPDQPFRATQFPHSGPPRKPTLPWEPPPPAPSAKQHAHAPCFRWCKW